MSLRYQILYRIMLSSLGILLLGGAIAVWQARQSVTREVDSSVHLAVQLINLGLANNRVFDSIADLSHLSVLQQTRHLSMQLQKPDGQIIHFPGESNPSDPDKMPPLWFVKLVKGDYPQVEHRLTTLDGQHLTLIIKPQPLDEITEAWQESTDFLASLALLTLLTFLAINLVLNKSLYAIDRIVATLQEIEAGHYQEKLPYFSSKEFDNIANAINKLANELNKTQQDNRALTQHSLAIQEEERQRLSQELHDELGQSLTAIKVMAVTATKQYPEAGKITTPISQICDHLTMVVRSMMQQLHPLILTELGLKAALEEMVNHWTERHTGLSLRIVCAEDIDQLDKNMTIQIFRVIQECLTNVVRHAQASEVSISLQIVQQSAERILHLTVKDNGKGCDLARMGGGFGVSGMKERIKSLGGVLLVESSPGQGMTVTANINV